MKQEIVCISTSTRHGIYHLGALWGMWWPWWKCAPLGGHFHRHCRRTVAVGGRGQEWKTKTCAWPNRLNTVN
jgi:hypothetical protein